ncbi:hypothetical protein [Dysgonomonas sp. GY617]|uniref:hypothetical protein n=1 Tax=Dysgonomonas sp. GY617 TaxID=2780420 RepID=UPI0018848E33|nr:hypothetical protein [Dysgonomonas sp. GY617]MBF0577397.1 hypothetical protein [Dysgonomonas sp. GY617]
MIIKKIPTCQEVKYLEFPDLIFGISEDGNTYFDATHYILCKGNIKIHSIKDFDIGFYFWKKSICDTYQLGMSDLIVKEETTGHIYIDEALAMLFIAYIDPGFGVYILERISEMLLTGIVLSDTSLLMMVRDRFTNDIITQITTEI